MALNTGERLAFGGTSFEAAEPADAMPAPAARSKAPDRGRDWGYAGLMFFTAVLLLRPQDQIRPLAVLHLAQVSAIIGVGAMFATRLRRHLALIPLTTETLGLFCFGFVMLATVPFSIWPGGALSEFVDSYLKVVLVFLLLVNTLTSPKRVEQITWLMLVCCGYIAFRAVFDYARGVNLVEHGRVAGAVSGIFGNPNDLALNMVTFLPAALLYALTKRYSAAKRLTASGLAMLMFATVVFTKSRAGVLGLGCMMAAFLVLGRRIRPAYTVGILAVMILATPFLPASFWNRISTIGNEERDKLQFTGSTEARKLLLQEGLNAFIEHPLTGVGAGQFKNYNPPGRKERWRETHNSPLQVAADLGVFGFAAFIFLIFCGARAAAQARRMARPRGRRLVDPSKRPRTDDEREWLYSYATALTAGLVGWFVCAFFASVAYSWTFYYLLALLVAARDLARDRLAQPLPHLSSKREKSATWTSRVA